MERIDKRYLSFLCVASGGLAKKKRGVGVDDIKIAFTYKARQRQRDTEAPVIDRERRQSADANIVGIFIAGIRRAIDRDLMPKARKFFRRISTDLVTPLMYGTYDSVKNAIFIWRPRTSFRDLLPCRTTREVFE